MKKLMLAVSVMLSLNVEAKPKAEKSLDNSEFYVYQDKGSKKNHFIPSNWMGNYGDFKFNDNYKTDCLDGLSCIQIVYQTRNTQQAGWGGIYWAANANNWGSKPGAIDLSGYKRLTFWAKADQDNVTINEFKMGGITGEFGDSDTASIGPISLSKDWKKYTIDLKDLNLSKVLGGFCFATADDVVPEKGYIMFLDEIRYEK